MRWVRPALASARLLRPRPGAALAIVHRPASHGEPLPSGAVTSSASDAFPLIRRFLSAEPGEDRSVHSVDKADVKRRMAERRLLLIDLRKPKEREELGAIPSSVNIPFGEIKTAFSSSEEEFRAKYGFDKPDSSGSKVVLHCMKGGRSTKAVLMLHEMGFTGARHYPSGFVEWSKEEEVVKKT